MSDKIKPCDISENGYCRTHDESAIYVDDSCPVGRRTPDARLEAERAVIVPEEGQSGCSEHWRPIDDDWSRDYWDEFDPFTRLDDAIRASRRRAK